MSGDEEKRRCAGQRLRDFHIEVVAEPCIWHSRLNCTSYGYIQAFMLYRVLEFSGAVRREGRIIRLSHYHGTSGLAQTREESVNTKVCIYTKIGTATS